LQAHPNTAHDILVVELAVETGTLNYGAPLIQKHNCRKESKCFAAGNGFLFQKVTNLKGRVTG